MRILKGVNWRILGTLVCQQYRDKMWMRKIIIITFLEINMIKRIWIKASLAMMALAVPVLAFATCPLCWF